MQFEQAEKIEHDLHPHLPSLRNFHSTKSLEDSPLFRELRPKILKVLNSYELALKAPPAPAEPFYRAVAWNIERGTRFEGIVHLLRHHPVLSKADILLITEADLGMARSGNRHVARDLASQLGMNYFFAPSYLNLAKGCGVEHEIDGENEVGIHGNAILSRYPLHRPRIVSIPNPHDKMRGREKRLGNQRALVITVDLPGHPVRVACTHVNVRSTQKDRKEEIERVVRAIVEEGEGPACRRPALIGGDWNTSTYDAHSAASAIFGFWVRVFMGVDNVMRHHYPHPERFFERDLFRMLESNGFDYKTCNRLGGTTNHYSVESIAQFKNLREWVPNWCFRFIRWSLRNHNGLCSFKLDWFTQRGLRPLGADASRSERKGDSIAPAVIGGLTHDDQQVSDHDAIAVDFMP